MRFAFAAIVLAGAVSTVSAISLQTRQQSFPTCAQSCVLNPPNLFGCDASDNKCLCESQQYVNATTQCIVAACDADDAATAEAFSRQLCAAVGVTLTSTPSTTPTAPAGSSTSSSSASTPAPTNTAPAGSSSSSSASSSAPAPTQTQNGAVSTGVNALIGAAALLLAVVNL